MKRAALAGAALLAFVALPLLLPMLRKGASPLSVASAYVERRHRGDDAGAYDLLDPGAKPEYTLEEFEAGSRHVEPYRGSWKQRAEVISAKDLPVWSEDRFKAEVVISVPDVPAMRNAARAIPEPQRHGMTIDEVLEREFGSRPPMTTLTETHDLVRRDGRWFIAIAVDEERLEELRMDRLAALLMAFLDPKTDPAWIADTCAAFAEVDVEGARRVCGGLDRAPPP